jgi:hypothetical protein
MFHVQIKILTNSSVHLHLLILPHLKIHKSLMMLTVSAVHTWMLDTLWHKDSTVFYGTVTKIVSLQRYDTTRLNGSPFHLGTDNMYWFIHFY